MAAHRYSSVKIDTGAGSSYRFAEEKLEILEGCVRDFFLGLPNVTCICISLLGGTRQSDDACSFSGCASDSSEEHVNWECPWAYSVVDDVAPQFKAILKENYLSNLTLTSADSKIDGFTWWSRKLQLNDRLDKFLR
ncbi:hypothetical protein QJS04_geneDACA020656 [Acorus gramineus]|uniref:Uncharacterized protein n=1 Tax=Acorus gramineus TaxID=55184 RepID=A0AAV9BUC0_ACOGR|nr:hypothetical protein QJS04_geneDACA020656 [Acorus gramineus]